MEVIFVKVCLLDKMLIYWLVFLVTAILATSRVRISPLGWSLLGLGLSIFIGLRYEVGGDWFTYVFYLARTDGIPLLSALQLKDPGYQLINWLVAKLGADVWLVNLFSATVFVAGLVRFIRKLPDPRLALVTAIPYMVIVMSMGYTRQAVAFGFVLAGLAYLLERRLISFIVLLAIATTFHKSAVILVPLAVLADTRNKFWTAIWVGWTGLLLFALFLQEHVDALWQNYVTAGYSQASEGGPIRVVMNVVPAALFLVFQKRLTMTSAERALWFWVALLSLVCLPLVFFAPTAVDRVALYFMPIHLVVFSCLPELVKTRDRILLRIAIVGFYGTVLFVWLNFAGHRDAWLPYQFWPLVRS